MKKHIILAGFVLCIAVAAFVHGGTELEMRARTLWQLLPNGGVYHPGPVVVGSGLLQQTDLFKRIPIQNRDTANFASANSRSSMNPAGTVRFKLFNHEYCHDPVLVFTNYYRGTGDPSIANSNSITIKASLDVSGRLYPVYFNGQRTYSLAGGGVVFSDPILVRLVPTDTLFVRIFFDVGSGGYIPTGWALEPGADALTYDSDLTDSGTPSPVASETYSYGPHAVMASPDSTAKPSVLIIGDSIARGTGDSGLNEPNAVTNTQLGFITRAIAAAGIGYTKITLSGSTVHNFASGMYMSAPVGKEHKYMISNYGTNDIYGNGRTVAQLKVDLILFWQYWSSKGLICYHTTILPRTTSSDSWTTMTGQSINLQSMDSLRQQINAWLMDKSGIGAIAQSNGALSGVFDAASKVETNSKWNVSGVIYTGTVQAPHIDNIRISQAVSDHDPNLENSGVACIYAGTGAGQCNRIYSVESNVLWVTPNWSVTPDTDSTYQVFYQPTNEGQHPSYWAIQNAMSAIDTTKLQ